MANDYTPHPAARSHAWRNNFVTYVNGHPADLGLAAREPPPGNPAERSARSQYGNPLGLIPVIRLLSPHACKGRRSELGAPG